MESSAALWLSASATSLASAVALFGPTVRSWWARPVITLHEPEDTLLNNDELIMVSPAEGEEDERLKFVLLEVTNHGRTQLEDLEAVLTAHQRIQPDADTDPDESFPALTSPSSPAACCSSSSRALTGHESPFPQGPRARCAWHFSRLMRKRGASSRDAKSRPLGTQFESAEALPCGRFRGASALYGSSIATPFQSKSHSLPAMPRHAHGPRPCGRIIGLACAQRSPLSPESH
jgi:hypothetical protein